MQLYTSGTTGLPKGVMLTNANLSTAIGDAGETFHIREDTVSLVAMPLFHIGGSGLGPVRHVTRRAIHHPARRRSRRAPPN